VGTSDILGIVSFDSSPSNKGKTRYFSSTGCVVEYADRRDVFVGGSLIGTFTPDDRATCNMLLVAAAKAKGVRHGKLAEAFGLGVVTARNIRRRFEKGGLPAIVKRGGKSKTTPKLVAQLDKLFDEGLTIDEAHRRIRKRVSRAVVGRVHKKWADARKAREQREHQAEQDRTRQQEFEGFLTVKKARRRAKRKPAQCTAVNGAEAEEDIGLVRATAWGGTSVQHLGSWVMRNRSAPCLSKRSRRAIGSA